MTPQLHFDGDPGIAVGVPLGPLTRKTAGLPARAGLTWQTHSFSFRGPKIQGERTKATRTGETLLFALCQARTHHPQICTIGEHICVQLVLTVGTLVFSGLEIVTLSY
jgi:hypothetical protein